MVEDWLVADPLAFRANEFYIFGAKASYFQGNSFQLITGKKKKIPRIDICN